MRARTYVIVGVIVVLIVGGFIVAELQRAKKTQELLGDLGTDAPDIAKDTMEELKKRGPKIEDELIRRTGSPRRKERMRAALLLGEVGTPQAGPALVGLLHDEWLPVRRAAVWALGKVGYQKAVRDLARVARDEDAEMDTRVVALQSLSLLCVSGLSEKDRRSWCVPVASQALARRPEMTEEALEAITKRFEDQAKAKAELEERRRTGKVKEEEAEEAVKEEEPAEDAVPEEPVPADDEIELRGQAVLLLGLTGVDEALPAILEATKEEVEPAALVRQRACMALEDLSETPGPPEEGAEAPAGGETAAAPAPNHAKDMAMCLQRALDDGDATVRMFAARALAKHASFGDDLKLLDDALNAKLVEMAQELGELGESGYWVREAARTACSARHVAYAETEPGPEGAQPKAALISAGGTGGN